MAQVFAITGALLTSLLLVGAFFTFSVLSGATGEAPRVGGGWRVGRSRRNAYRDRMIAKEQAKISARVAKRGGARMARDGDSDVDLVLRLTPSLDATDRAHLSSWARDRRPPRGKSVWTTPFFIATKLAAKKPKVGSLVRFYSELIAQLLDYVGRGAAAGILVASFYWFVAGGPPDGAGETLNLVALISFIFATVATSVWVLRKLDELLPDRLAALLLVVVMAGFFYWAGQSIWQE